jgi:hypothetical protein
MNAQSISQSNPGLDQGIIENASAIIQLFGGIRPMAGKLGVPVTTVQGWKKRGVIPANRLEQIKASAEKNAIVLGDLLKVVIPNAPIRATDTKPNTEQMSKTGFATRPTSAQKITSGNPMAGVVYEDVVFKVSQAQRSTLMKSALINAVFVLVATAAVVLLLIPQGRQQSNQKIATLEQQLAQVKIELAAAEAQQKDRTSAIESLQRTTAQAQKIVDSAINQAGSAAETFGPVISSMINQSVNALGGDVMRLSSFVGRIQNMKNSNDGQAVLNAAWQSLSSAMAGANTGAVDTGSLLSAATQNNPAAQQAFAGLAPQDVKAAALLLGMAQMRTSLYRDNVPFKNDLETLKALAATDDPELAAALDKLGPQAEKGILTPQGLAGEFTGVAKEVVMASLSGQNVSIQDKAMARFNDVFKIEKDGALVTGTPEQAAVASTEKLLQSGDIEGAIAAMGNLQGPAAAAAAPWISKAKATLMAQQLRNMLNRNLGLAGIYGPRSIESMSGEGTISPARKSGGGYYVRQPMMPSMNHATP